MMKILLPLLVMVALVWTVESARILAFIPFPAKSHQRVIQPLLINLAERGHHVTCVTPHPPANTPKNYRAITVPDYMSQLKKLMGKKGVAPTKDDYKQMGGFSSMAGMIFFKEMGIPFTEWTLNQTVVQDLISSNEQFDAVILETTFFQENFIALGHKFNAPVIEYMPAGNLLWTYWLNGNPFDNSYISEAIFPFTDHMTFRERLFNTVLSSTFRLVWYMYYMPKYQTIMDEKLRYEGWENRPSMMDMVSNTSLVLVNTHFSVNYPFPYAPHFKEVGGLNIEPLKPLPKDLQNFMDDAKDGVIYFTLGSHIDVSGVLGDELKDVFSKVFSELKQKVLWKWETEFPDAPSNVKISKWFPQQDILAHKNLKLFITHGGLLSTTEAVNQGIPTVGIPVMADQFKNVQIMTNYKFGVPLYLNNITYDSLKWAITEVLTNPEYAKNAKKQSAVFRDKPNTALETAVYWTEYVIRHKGAHHLRPAIATMPWYQQAMVDVYLAIAAIILIPLYILYKSVRCFCKLLCRFRSTKKSTKKQKTQ